MQEIRILSIPTDEVLVFQNGALDANGMSPELQNARGGSCPSFNEITI